jgi:hypothetical protein
MSAAVSQQTTQAWQIAPEVCKRMPLEQMGPRKVTNSLAQLTLLSGSIRRATSDELPFIVGVLVDDRLGTADRT